MPGYNCDTSRPGKILSLDLAGDHSFYNRRQRIFTLLQDNVFSERLDEITINNDVRDALEGVLIWIESEDGFDNDECNPQLFKKVKCGDLGGWITFLTRYEDNEDREFKKKVRELGQLLNHLRNHVKSEARLSTELINKGGRNSVKINPDRREKLRAQKRGRRR